MTTAIRLSIKEANELADQIEAGGGDASLIRAAAGKVTTRAVKSPDAAVEISDDDYVAAMRQKASVQEGPDLECAICHSSVNTLISGVCEECFRSWMLSVKK